LDFSEALKKIFIKEKPQVDKPCDRDSNAAVRCACAMPLHFPFNHHPSMIAPMANLPFVSPQESIERRHKLEQQRYQLQTQHGGDSQKEK
jgi:hypothetical protein